MTNTFRRRLTFEYSDGSMSSTLAMDGFGLRIELSLRDESTRRDENLPVETPSAHSALDLSLAPATLPPDSTCDTLQRRLESH